MPMFSKMAFTQPGKGLHYKNAIRDETGIFEIIFVPLNLTCIEVLVWYKRKASKVLAEEKIISETKIFT